MPTALPQPSAADPKSSAAPAPELTLLSDAVPRLLPGLHITPRPGEAGLFDVAFTDGSGRSFTLYDFEVSIARMLDGRRTAAQLIEAAAKIGIPVTLDSLRKFVRQLRAYGFIQAVTSPDEQEEAWAGRGEWRPEVRELFQSALRTFRNDRPTEARGYVEALLQIEPDLPDAVELLERIEQRILSGEPIPAPAFDQIHGPDSPDEPLTFEPDEGTPAVVSEDAYEDETEVSPRPRRRWPLALAAVVLIAGGLAIPVPSHVSASAELVAAGTPTALIAPRAGTISEELVKPGAWVKAGQTVIRLEDGELAQREKSLHDAVDALKAQIDRLQKRAQTRSAQKAKAALEKKQAQAAQLTHQRDALAQRSDSRSRRKLRSVERSLSRKQRDVAKLQKSYERKTGAARLQTLLAEQKTQSAELAQVTDARARSVITAAKDGTFQPTRRTGDPVMSGEQVATLVDARKVMVMLGIPTRQATRVKEGQPVSLRVSGSDTELHTVILNTSGESAGPGLVRATATLDNAARKLTVGASGLAEIDCGKQALYARLLGGR